MVATNTDLSPDPAALKLTARDFARASRWLKNTGWIPLSEPAWWFLAARLRARTRRVIWFGIPMMIATVVAAGLMNAGHRPGMLAGLMSGVIVVLACYLATDCTADARVLRRHDSWPAARLSRGWTMPVSDLVGRPRWVAYWFMAGFGALQLDALIPHYPVREWIPVTSVYAVAWIATVALLLRARTRPTLAFDGASLAIDERLRSHDAAMPLVNAFFFGVATFGNASASLSALEITLSCLWTFSVGVVGYLCAVIPRRWPDAPRWVA